MSTASREYLQLLNSYFRENKVSSLSLIINYEIVRYESNSNRYICKNSPEVHNISFIVHNQGSLTCKKLEILSEDLLDFCQRIYFSGFATSICGMRSADILEYDFLKNRIVIHNHNYSTPITISLNEKNVRDIKNIANPQGNRFCVLY